MKKIIAFIIIFIVLLLLFLYFNDYYRSDESVYKYLENSDAVKIKKNKYGYFFDGNGEKDALIFYPGAKVEYTSYAPLMNSIASNGVDCFLIKMPLNIAFFNPNVASKIIDKYDYDKWYLSGHSLGGVVASSYINSNNKKIDGLILLASYSTKNINSSVRVLSIYGDLDGVLNIENYKKNKKNLNNCDELIINGGNHSGFGNYGFQKGDKKSKISNEIQQNITTDKIISFIINY